MDRIKIAYIDDHELNLECLNTILRNDFLVDIFVDANEFLNKFSQTAYSAILMDVYMPKMDGFSLYEKVIEHPDYNGCPVLFISSDDSTPSRIRSFELGAVDFFNRDILPDELILRIKAKIKFFEKHRSIVEFGGLRLNLTLLKGYLYGNELHLTFIELRILLSLLKIFPDFISKENIISDVWRNENVLDATLYTHVFNLNSKLKEWNHEIRIVKGKGKGLSIQEKLGD